MEVRSNNEKCGNDAVALTTTTPTTINPKSLNFCASDDGFNVGRNKSTSQPLTKDEKLMAELKAQMPDVDNIFHIHRRIGEGTFSTVFLTSLRCHERTPMHKKRLFALKYLIPTSHPKRIARELKCLKEIGGKENVVGVDLCLRNNDSIAFVMPYIPHDRFHDYFDRLTVKELQDYMRNLLIALNHVHAFKVIHRDVKPSNFLHDRQNKKYLLVDFGLAQELDPEMSCDTDRRSSLGNSNNNNNNRKPASDGSVECDKKVAAKGGATVAATNEQISCEPMEVDDNCESIAEMVADSMRPNKRRPSHSDETENKCSSIDSMNLAKRQRTSIAINGTANVIQNANNNNNNNHNHNINTPTSQHSTSYIPSQFKTPLKQMNEISMKKMSNELNSPLSADIKSAILGYSIHSKLQINGTSMPQRITPPNHKYKLNNRINGSTANIKCYCYGRPTVCNICLVKREIQATRAGTPGYRPTEVLLKYPNQTTAVDIWAAGVILISILSGCYPFFKSTDDFTALAEIITVFGDEMVKKTAFELGRHVCISHKKRPLHLRKLCMRLRNRTNNNNMENNTQAIGIRTNSMEYCTNCEQMDMNCLCEHTNFNMDFSNDMYPDSVYDLLHKLLAINPFKRITANDALQHPFFKECY